ncbi:MAG: hypothetical protein ACP5M9_02650 [Candidatus Micrarchaeia archaeon]
MELSSKIDKVENNIKECLITQKALFEARRKDIKKTIYTGAIAIGLSVPVIVVNYIPIIENFIKNKDLNPRTLGEMGFFIGTNILVNGVVRSIEYLRIDNEIEKKRNELESFMRDQKVETTQNNNVNKGAEKRRNKNKMRFKKSTDNPKFRKN